MLSVIFAWNIVWTDDSTVGMMDTVSIVKIINKNGNNSNNNNNETFMAVVVIITISADNSNKHSN